MSPFAQGTKSLSRREQILSRVTSEQRDAFKRDGVVHLEQGEHEFNRAKTHDSYTTRGDTIRPSWPHLSQGLELVGLGPQSDGQILPDKCCRDGGRLG